MYVSELVCLGVRKNPEIEKRQKRGFKRLPEPKLRKSQPGGGKPDLAHLSGPLSQKRIFPKIEKRQKRGFKRLPEPKLRKFEPEGEKPTLAQLSGPLSQTRIFPKMLKKKSRK